MDDNPLLIFYTDVCVALECSPATWRSFCTLSKPMGLPYRRVAGPNQRKIRAYEHGPLVAWLRRAIPERMNARTEARLLQMAVNERTSETT